MFSPIRARSLSTAAAASSRTLRCSFDPYFIILSRALQRRGHPFANSSSSRLPTRGENSFYWNRRWQSRRRPSLPRISDSLIEQSRCLPSSSSFSSYQRRRNTRGRSKHLNLLVVVPRKSVLRRNMLAPLIARVFKTTLSRTGGPHDRRRHVRALSSLRRYIFSLKFYTGYFPPPLSFSDFSSRSRSPRQVPPNFIRARHSSRVSLSSFTLFLLHRSKS